MDHKPRQDSPFPRGFQFDYVNADALMTRLSIKDGDIVNTEGNRWRVLWLPHDHCRRITPVTLQKIKELLLAGGTVIGEAPDLNPTLSGGEKADVAFDGLVSELWGDATSGDRRIGNGRLLWGGSLEKLLAKQGVTPDVSGTLPERWCHRRVDDTDIYFVIGNREQSLDANLHFRSRGTPEFWDPVDGSVTPISTFKTTDNGTTIPVRLPVSGSVFVVFRPEQTPSQVERIALNGDVWLDVNDERRIDTSASYPPYGVSRKEPIQPWGQPQPLTFQLTAGGQELVAWKDGEYRIKNANGKTFSIEVSGTQSIPLQSNWSLSFPKGWDAPDSLHLDSVQPWSEMSDKGIRHFSGTATYQTTFALEKLNTGDKFVLDLGQVGNIAKVIVNGNDAGVLWTWPFRTDITNFVKQSENKVSIAVTNTWHNRLAYDADLSPDKRKTWTIAGPEEDSLLEFSGLGPNVQLRLGKTVALSKVISASESLDRPQSRTSEE